MARKLITTAVILFITLVIASCYDASKAPAVKESSQMHKTYKVHKLNQPMKLDANWNKPQWQKAQTLNIALYMGEKPDFIPKTQAKVLYDNEYLYVIFRVEETAVRALETQYHGKVWEDSCVEFFVTPDGDISKGYFNFEVNCIGTILCYHQVRLEVDSIQIPPDQLKQMNITTSFPKGRPIDPELSDLHVWTVEYRVPLKLLEKYHPVIKPAAGVKWRANFFKCAETNSNPHWLTWSLVKHPTPNFHIPEDFGTLEFVD